MAPKKWWRKRTREEAQHETDLLRRYVKRVDDENPADYDDRFAALKDWGLELADLTAEAERIANDLDVEPFSVALLDVGDGKEMPLGHYNLAERRIEFNATSWPNRSGWKRLIAVAH